jgi:hypothetical protein
MYLWKYWRESRVTFAVSLLLVGLMLWIVLKMVLPPRGQALQTTADISLLAGSLLVVPFSFLAWRFGSFGVGRDLGERSGSYLFTRPRRRAFFVWNDWGFGMAQLLAVVVAAYAVIAFGIYRATTDHVVHIAGGAVSMYSIFGLHIVAAMLLTGLIFGLTYLCSVLIRSRGLMLSVGVLLTYSIVKAVIEYRWPGVKLPGLTLTEFNQNPTGNIAFASNLGLSIALRAGVALLFPIAAQWLLQTRDID